MHFNFFKFHSRSYTRLYISHTDEKMNVRSSSKLSFRESVCVEQVDGEGVPEFPRALSQLNGSVLSPLGESCLTFDCAPKCHLLSVSPHFEKWKSV